MVEVYLKMSDSEILRFPVPPSEFGPDSGLDVQTANVHNVGEVGLIGKLALRTFSIDTYFPAAADNLCQYTSFPKPDKCVSMIEKWRASGLPIRLIITGSSMDVNVLASIPEFSARERAGVAADIWFSMTLQEYREITPRKLKGGGKLRAQSSPASAKNTYTVKKGDTIQSVAKKVYGSADKWKDLAKMNKLSTKQVPKLKVGQKLKY